ncbi:Copper, lead, cadmium, zinc and mercury transporting ATPase [Anaerovibrio sp. JC8]|uniref:heavy metal translocating P-type ATPase n=1 Tax=Anaerovibrio sp. JC8 TaxID=1240085 RepID=UPI000A0E86BF|nr:heavy metal translocating P-type ATPase [Anaerovibrio sp. JC8]ORU01193.1 Copper, lead, cadmium, zinc and mercury transporting ATPase [Anaerovibrio sp. JC8]
MNAKQKQNLIRIAITTLIMTALYFIPAEGVFRFTLYIIPYFIIGHDILLKAAKGIKNRQPFDENLLMAVATLGAIVLALYRSGDYVEAIAVMLFYQVGEWFQSYAVGKSRKDIADLMDIAPDYANIEDDQGQLEQVDPDEVEIGSVIVVKPGERVPIDGIVVEGNSTLNTAALTGESLPRDVAEQDEIISGSINLSGVLKVRTTKEFGESTASKILELIEDASSRKSKSEEFITRFARVYTPIVVYAAIALAVIPPVVLTAMNSDPMWGEWFYRALTFLIISCPCALVISIPLSFFAGLGAASRHGVLVKGSNYMETLSEVGTVVFDKTGTLTKGTFSVVAIHPEKLDQNQLLHMAAHVERYSSHPIALSLLEAYPDEHDDCRIEQTEEIAGRGIKALINGDTVYVGNSRMMEDLGIQWKPCEHSGTIVHVAINGEYEGHIVVSDTLKPHSKEAIKALRAQGIKETVMLTGDTRAVAEKVAGELGLNRVISDLLPQDKVREVEKLLEKNSTKKYRLAFVGDGINDAPVLSRADIGIAMGAMGSDAAIEAADVVLMDDDPYKIATAIRISRKCLRIVKQNIWFAIGVKVLVLLAGAIGFASMWAAIFADVGVAVLAILNSMRCMYVKSERPQGL